MKTARIERKCTHCKGSMAWEDERDQRCRECRIKCGSEIIQQTPEGERTDAFYSRGIAVS